MPPPNLNFWNVHRICAEIDITSEQPILDLSGVTFFSPFALVYLGMFFRHFNSKGSRFHVMPPTAPHARGYLARQQFWERFNFDPRTVKLERLRRLTTTTSLNDIVDIEINDYIADQVAEKLVKVLTDCKCQLPAGKVALIASELVDNFAQHSGQNLAAPTFQFYPTPRNLLIAIADCGIGIRESLASNPKYAWLAERPHHVAVLEAFKPTVSRKPEGGTGFTDVLEGVTELGGQLRLATGNEYVIVKKGKATAGRMSFDLPGVQIELSLPEGK